MEKNFFRVSLLPEPLKSFSQFPPSIYRRSMACTKIQRGSLHLRSPQFALLFLKFTDIPVLHPRSLAPPSWSLASRKDHGITVPCRDADSSHGTEEVEKDSRSEKRGGFEDPKELAEEEVHLVGTFAYVSWSLEYHTDMEFHMV